MSQIIKHKNKKIWVTIEINFTGNNTLELIKMLPFNSSDYNDLLIVAGDRLKSNLLYSKADLLDSIAFTYEIRDRQTNTSINKYKTTCIFSLLVLSAVLLTLYYPVEVYSSPCILEAPEEVLNNKLSKNKFNLFLNLFKADSCNLYYPSKFLPLAEHRVVVDITNDAATLLAQKELARSFIVDCVRSKQYETLNYLTKITVEHINTMQTISKEYSNMITDHIK